ncbi:X-box-binding protein 1 isoform X1 [Maniola hyperantus]|uniref:X-box-binding protein 1 isoform X1 n=1 Tax=Aphantopus hyperantus TaxID=2795564 RepID=UPI00156855F9|nr:X-box-binding protein 1 isoform X1 [Maniola hyperantus]
MVMVSMKKMSTPIIITVPNNYLAVDEDSQVVVDVAPAPPSRKRRLDHLTWEEKMQRNIHLCCRKLKNRVAAQTSRDRKKAKMDEMESRIQHFMDTNERLIAEVENLKAMNERLLSENTALRSAAAARTVAEAPRPAESLPQQKEGPPTAIRAARLLLTMCLLSQTSSQALTPMTTSTSCISSPTPSSRKLVQLLRERLQMSKSGTLESALKELKWWGPQQSNWNPVKVES